MPRIANSARKSSRPAPKKVLETVSVSQTLQGLEERLLTRAVRHNAQEVSSLLANEFREFGTSGRVFSKAEIIDLLQSESPATFCLESFKILPLANQNFLATYRVVKEAPDQPSITSLRSSIWILREGQWQIIFHQGTIIPE